MKKRMSAVLAVALSLSVCAAAWAGGQESGEDSSAAGLYTDEAQAETQREADTEAETETEFDPVAWCDSFLDRPKGKLVTVSEGDVSISKRTYPCFLYLVENESELPLYFIDNGMEVPYIEVNDLCDVLTMVYHQLLNDTGYGLQLDADGPVVGISRESGYTMLIDYDEGTVFFDDYDAFIHRSTDTCLLESVSTFAVDEGGNELLLKRNEKGSYDRYGKAVEICLADYDIPLYRVQEKGLYLFPLQTMGDFLLSQSCSIDVAFNERAVVLGSSKAIRNSMGLSTLGMMYGSGPGGPMSEELAGFSYNELCLVMDKLYGLKDLHGITDFDDLFTEIGYKEKLQSTDSDVKDGALSDILTFYLDDIHSGMDINSFRTYEPASQEGNGLSRMQIIADYSRFKKARDDSKHKVIPYEEVGNTAYVTFDSFNLPRTAEAYYQMESEPEADDFDLENPNIDTVALIMYAHRQITRKDSPVENVVLDLSLNDGGAIDAAVAVAAWFLGEAKVSMQSTLTGARSTGVYQADINLDGEYDEKDTVSDKNLYCLISPNSFSCGNLVPAILKNAHSVTLIGQTSGGGSCEVNGLTTAYGSFFSISSPNNLSYVKNGSYYEIDGGVEPDYRIAKPASFYDREALNDYINGLF